MISYPHGRAERRAVSAADRRRTRSAKQAWDIRLGWILPIVALATPLAPSVTALTLQICLMLGAAAGLAAAGRSGAVGSILIWGVATGGLGAGLAFFDAPNGASLTLAVLTVAAAQALALLGVGRPATIAGWNARGQVLLALAGPAALALLAVNTAPTWDSLAAAVAVAVDLAALPLALEARRRAAS